MAHQSAIDSALDVLKAHIAGLNARDEDAIAASLHFPHIRLSGTQLATWQTQDSYFKDFQARAGSNWARSLFEDIRVVDASADKVHLDVTVVRCDALDQEIARFRSLWVVTCEEGRWAAKMRSSFAPR